MLLNSTITDFLTRPKLGHDFKVHKYLFLLKKSTSMTQADKRKIKHKSPSINANQPFVAEARLNNI